MRTQPAHIEPACPYCNEDHNPDIECRCRPVALAIIERPQAVRDSSGRIIAVRTARLEP